MKGHKKSRPPEGKAALRMERENVLELGQPFAHRRFHLSAFGVQFSQGLDVFRIMVAADQLDHFLFACFTKQRACPVIRKGNELATALKQFFTQLVVNLTYQISPFWTPKPGCRIYVWTRGEIFAKHGLRCWSELNSTGVNGCRAKGWSFYGEGPAGQISSCSSCVDL